jgi:selenocysteine lyase/cysteine desulfurase
MDYRREFADFEGVAYLNVANEGPLPLAAVRAAQAALEWKKLPHVIQDSIYVDLPNRVREKISRLIGAAPDEVALTTGASGGLSAVAAGFEYQPGDEVVIARGEFPAHVATWLPYQNAGRVRIRVIRPRARFIAADDFLEQIGPRTRLVSGSLVRFDDASLLDAARVAEACHAKGAALLLDLSQCAGAMPMRIRDLGADFAVCAGYKWLLSPYGTGFFWIAREWIPRLQLGPCYWQALAGAENFSALPLDDPKISPGARRWDSPETANFTNLAAMEASLDFILSVGAETIARHNAELVREIIDRLPRDRCVLASPVEAERRGTYVCVAARKPEETAKMRENLREAKIYVALRENALRISPHLYNTREDVERLIRVLSV